MLDYSVEKFNLYVKSAQRVGVEGRAAEVIDTMVSISGALSGGKVVDKHLNSLEKLADNGE